MDTPAPPLGPVTGALPCAGKEEGLGGRQLVGSRRAGGWVSPWEGVVGEGQSRGTAAPGELAATRSQQKLKKKESEPETG